MRYRKKVKRFNEPGHAHFLTFSCFQRLPLLSKDRTRTWFVQSLQAARNRYEFDIWAWVIMPEHVHLLIHPRPAAYSISAILSSIKRPVAADSLEWLQLHAPAFLKRLTVQGTNRVRRHFWQAGGGQDRNIYDPRAAHQVIEYIHGNPVRRGLVQLATDWPWSSARAWDGLDEGLIKVDRTVPPVSEWS